MVLGGTAVHYICDMRLACVDTAGGFAIGFALGFITKWLLRLLRSRGAKAPEEMALTVAMAYLAFYLANAPGMPLPINQTFTV